jgi:hypothetical protein
MTTIEMDDDDDDDETSWIPMQLPDDQSCPRVAHSVDLSRSNEEKPRRSERASHGNDNNDRRSRSKNLGSSGLQNIQRKLEDRISIQTNLVDRPLDYFWQRCLINLVRQVWALEIRIQLAILMLVTGLLTRLFLWFTWYLMYPRFAILSMILVASLLYVDPFDMNDRLRGTWSMFEALLDPSASRQNALFEDLDTRQIRSLSFLLFMIPFVLEIRTFSLLSRINAELTWNNAAGANSDGWLVSSPYCYNIGVAICISSAMLFLRRVKRMKPCDVSYRGLLILYGFSLLITIVSFESDNNDLRRIPVLAAPFLTATATLLLVYEDDSYEWLSRITRQTFRLSLRDVFSLISERVTEDDMLQLAILRWICDFWASSPVKAATQSTQDPKNSVPTASSGSLSESLSTKEQHSHSSAKPNQSSELSSEEVSFEHSRIRWEELQPMLNIEIDHMETEIGALRIDSTSGSHGDETSLSRPQRDSWNASNHSKAMISVDQGNHHALMALRSQLLSLDVDERAKPAVSAYRRAVGSFPPKKKTAVTISVLRRCPAFLTMILHALFLSDIRSLFLTSLVLFPFVVTEYYRIAEWMEACQRVVSSPSNVLMEEQEENDWRIPVSLRNVDAMTILLSEDGHTVFRMSSLLKVWFNIVSSVSALEAGLSTARCVETTAVAIEFAGSAMSLVNFGIEISQNGISHGIMVLAKEVLSIYGDGKDITNLDLSDHTSAQYTGAAIRAVRYGEKMVRNVHSLSEDQNVMSFAQPLLNLLAMLTGERRDGEKDKEENNSVSVSADTHHEARIDDVRVEDKKNKKLESATDRQNEDGCAIEVDELQTMITQPEEETNSGKPKVLNFELPAQCDVIPNSPTPGEKLSEVMEMIAKSYELGLIDQSEKDDFFKKLCDLQIEELHDPSLLSAMKRTLTIILENGSMVAAIEDAESSKADHQKSQSDKISMSKECEVDSSLNSSLIHDISANRSILSENDREVDVKERKESQASQSTKENSDLVALGVAAFGIVASGIALTMRHDDKKSDRKQHSIVAEENTNGTGTMNEERKQVAPSATVIDDLADQNTEDDWVALGD